MTTQTHNTNQNLGDVARRGRATFHLLHDGQHGIFEFGMQTNKHLFGEKILLVAFLRTNR